MTPAEAARKVWDAIGDLQAVMPAKQGKERTPAEAALDTVAHHCATLLRELKR